MYWMDIDAGDRPSALRRVRLTFFAGADVLPVFSPDGKKLMWTTTRAGGHQSQLFIADFVPPEE